MTQTEADTERGLDRVSTGIDGLDRVTRGGLIAERSYVVGGPAGSGKTLLALSFLDGADDDETTLLVNLEEDPADMVANAQAVGIAAESFEICDISPTAAVFSQDGTYDVFEPDEVESETFRDTVREAVEETDPDRVVVDPITQLQYLTPDVYQFRQQTLGLARYLTDRGATAVFTAQNTESAPIDDLQFVTDGLIALDPTGPVDTVSVPKFRGSGTADGEHAYRIDTDGVAVYPALSPQEAPDRSAGLETVSSGVPELDGLLGGGVERGTVTILSGPTGAGKTTLATQFAAAAAERGEHAVLYLFEERAESFRQRSEAVGIPVAEMEAAGRLEVHELEPLAYPPQEFATRVRTAVEDRGAEFVGIDGVSGYRVTLQGREEQLGSRLHALCRYLNGADVTTFLTDETHGVVGEFTGTGEDVSYLADTILFVRYLELDGEIRRAAGVLKKRTGDFERALRRFEIGADGVTLGEPLTGLHGILSGTPRTTGE
ncbi:ATPase domain-containing protein [Halobaculum sp. MBLA0143]|uniref:ATPase domain-containing protein n=1 Tax=Halobaculum sp. MBLA0143 TaxID=3079933 RepID=UPI0035239BF9